MEKRIIQKHIEDAVEKCSKKEILSSVYNSFDNAKDSYNSLLDLAEKKIEDFNKNLKSTDSWGDDEDDFYNNMTTILSYAQIQKEFIEGVYEGLDGWDISVPNIDLSSLDLMELNFVQSHFDTDTVKPTGRVSIRGNYPKFDDSWFDVSKVNLDVIEARPTHFNNSFKKDLVTAIENCQKKTAKAHSKCERGYALISEEKIKRAYS